jgi:predicted Zn-dependent protease
MYREIYVHQELEADRDTVTSLRDAGLDPCAQARVHKRLLDTTGQREHPTAFLSRMNLLRESELLRICQSS